MWGYRSKSSSYLWQIQWDQRENIHQHSIQNQIPNPHSQDFLQWWASLWLVLILQVWGQALVLEKVKVWDLMWVQVLVWGLAQVSEKLLDLELGTEKDLV